MTPDEFRAPLTNASEAVLLDATLRADAAPMNPHNMNSAAPFRVLTNRHLHSGIGWF
jgi:hypothetical protein